VVIVAAQALAVQLAKQLAPGTVWLFYAMFMGPMIAAALFAGWWLFASRLPRRDRWLTLAAVAAIGGLAFLTFHKSMGLMTVIVFALPTVMMAWAIWLLVTPFLGWPARRTGLVVVVALAWGYYALVRLDGIDGSMKADLVYRWIPNSEERFLAGGGASNSATESPASADGEQETLELQAGDWPGFRGPDRDSRVPGVRLAANWDEHPPREMWRRRVGPGWSSFAVIGKRLYTQEQLGEDEAVICYDAASGNQLWVHRDDARFEEVLAGPGPRATPTFHEGKLFSLGAKGKLNCLDAATGKPLWSRDIVGDSGAKVPMWGFASSPLIFADVVTVFAGGQEKKGVLGYAVETGEPVWSGATGELSYCSMQLARLAGVEQLVIATDRGLAAFEPREGKALWTYEWQLAGMYRVIQPAVVGDADVLIGTGMGIGTQRVHLVHTGEEWIPKEVWLEPTRAMRPYYNDFVIHQGHIYGFDGNFFACVNLEDGKGKWKARGYGNGQVLLLADQDELLILSETGEVALVDARPEMHKERCKFKALTGKTWNHPVIAHGKLYVRNGEEAACFELQEEIETGIASRQD
jgi:outer membrane protein assembly factor BamB